MPINLVSSLDSGNIAALLEVFAIFLGLLIASNLQAIVSLAARRRLYSHGTARLRDSTWNVGVVQGFTNPGRLLRDVRALLAFTLAICVISLEVLTVFETNSSNSCAFGESSTWKVEKSSQKCFSRAAEADNDIVSSYTTSKYVDGAREKAKDVDLKLGIPVETNVFEESIISGKAVAQLRDGKYTERYTAPESDSFKITGGVLAAQGIPFVPVQDRSGKDSFNEFSCAFEVNKDRSRGEAQAWIPRNVEYRRDEQNLFPEATSTTGFVEIQPCLDELVVRECEYVAGRKNLTNELAALDEESEVECAVHVISREGRRTDAHSIGSVLYGEETIDTPTIRRAVLVSLIAQNSASIVPCERYLAAPKKCTQIGWVSMSAVFILISLFVITSLTWLGMKMASRGAANFNGSPQRLAKAMFDHFEGPGKKASHGPSKRKRREKLLGEVDEDDIYMSVLKGRNDPDSYHLVWTRGPIEKPAAYIPSSAISPHAEMYEDEVEVSLV